MPDYCYYQCCLFTLDKMIKLVSIIILSPILFNLINSRIDAYRILKDKTIAHSINLTAYFLFVAAGYIYLRPDVTTIILGCLQAFFNRQVAFDIPLNLRRRKNDKTITWDYVSKANPPAAWFDRIEIKIFGRNGRKIALWYISLWLITIICLICKFRTE